MSKKQTTILLVTALKEENHIGEPWTLQTDQLHLLKNSIAATNTFSLPQSDHTIFGQPPTFWIASIIILLDLSTSNHDFYAVSTNAPVNWKLIGFQFVVP